MCSIIKRLLIALLIVATAHAQTLPNAFQNFPTSFGALALGRIISPASLGASQNNYLPVDATAAIYTLANSGTVRITASTPVDITGLDVSTILPAADGVVRLLHNVGTNAVTLKANSVSSTAGNRFKMTSDVVLAADQICLVQYDGSTSRWRILNTGSGGGGGSGTVTTFSAGDLTPLFTTTETNITTAPALSFTLSTAAANSWFGNATGSTAAPDFNTTAFPQALIPALTGDVTKTSGSSATTYNNAVPTTKGGLPTGGTVNQVLSKIDSTNYNTQWVTPGGGGNVSNSGTPTANQLPIWVTATTIKGVTGVNGGTTGQILKKNSGTDYDWSWGSDLVATTGTFVVSDAATNAIANPVAFGHTTSATPVANFGTGITFNADDSTTDLVPIGGIQYKWTTAAHGLNNSMMEFLVDDVGAVASVRASLDSNGKFDAAAGFTVGSVAATSGKLLQGDGVKFIGSTATWPTSPGTSGKLVQSDGTNLVMSTATYPATAGTSGNLLTSNGTNFTSTALSASNITTGTLPAAQLSTNTRKEQIAFSIDGGGSAISTGKIKGFRTFAQSGTITAWSIVADTGTITVKFWKIATGTTKPTSANSINTSGVALSTGTAVRSTTLTDFTSTTVGANDIFACNVESVTGATEVSINLEVTTD